MHCSEDPDRVQVYGDVRFCLYGVRRQTTKRKENRMIQPEPMSILFLSLSGAESFQGTRDVQSELLAPTDPLQTVGMSCFFVRPPQLYLAPYTWLTPSVPNLRLPALFAQSRPFPLDWSRCAQTPASSNGQGPKRLKVIGKIFGLDS